MKAALAASPPSMKITDSPEWMVSTPLSAAPSANDCELSSIRQPVMSMSKAVLLVTSNQSAPTGLSPLDQGATSEMNSLPTVPGEPISLASFVAAAAPWTPALASAVSGVAVPLMPAQLSKVGNGPDGEAPNATLALRLLSASNRLTWSPPVLSPTPPPL